MNKCFDCGLVFEEPVAYSEDCTPDGSFEGGSFINKIKGCPHCEGAFAYVEECAICGEWSYPAYGNSFSSHGFVCQLCNDELEEVEENENE